MSKTYEDGLNDAWEAARRICAVESGGGLPVDVVTKLFGNGLVFVNFSAQEAIKKLEEYDKTNFQAGDIVESVGVTRMVMGTKGVVTAVSKNPKACWIMWSNGEAEYCDSREIEKTSTVMPGLSSILHSLKALEDNS